MLANNKAKFEPDKPGYLGMKN